MALPRLFPFDPDERRHRELLAQWINRLVAGELDNVGTFTLTANVTTTTVTDNRFQSNQIVVWTPTTANAAGAMTNLYLSTRNNGSFVLTHSNTATTDRIFRYARFG